MRLPLVTNDTIYQQHCMLLWLNEQDYILAYVCVLSSSHSVCLFSGITSALKNIRTNFSEVSGKVEIRIRNDWLIFDVICIIISISR